MRAGLTKRRTCAEFLLIRTRWGELKKRAKLAASVGDTLATDHLACEVVATGAIVRKRVLRKSIEKMAP
ncbi:hypothetical protein D9M72_418160 [compost metagenome]